MEASDHFAYCSEIWADPKYTIVLEQRGRIMVMQVKFWKKRMKENTKPWSCKEIYIWIAEMMPLDLTEEQCWTQQIALCQELFSMIRAKAANKKHQTRCSFHSKGFGESQQQQTWPAVGVLLIICLRQMMQKSQSPGTQPSILMYRV